jgi:hypothetical protein
MALRSTTNPVIRLLRLQLICDRPKGSVKRLCGLTVRHGF